MSATVSMIIPISPVLVADANKKLFSVSLLVSSEKRVCDERWKCKRLWSELYKHLKHPTTLSTIKFKGGRNNPL